MPERETIDQVLDVFLREQRLRLSDRTYRNYKDVIRLLRHSLDGAGRCQHRGGTRARRRAGSPGR